MQLLILTWLLVAAAVATLALRRLSLTGHDRLIAKAHTLSFDLEHLKLRRRIGIVDRWGQNLTIVVVAYGIALALFVAYALYDEAIRKLGELIRLL
jgi:hypothetical protein